MFVAKAVQFKPNREQPMPHAPLLASERVHFCWSARVQGVQQTFDASGKGHGFSSRLVPLWPPSTLRVRRAPRH